MISPPKRLNMRVLIMHHKHNSPTQRQPLSKPNKWMSIRQRLYNNLSLFLQMKKSSKTMSALQS